MFDIEIFIMDLDQRSKFPALRSPTPPIASLSLVQRFPPFLEKFGGAPSANSANPGHYQDMFLRAPRAFGLNDDGNISALRAGLLKARRYVGAALPTNLQFTVDLFEMGYPFRESRTQRSSELTQGVLGNGVALGAAYQDQIAFLLFSIR